MPTSAGNATLAISSTATGTGSPNSGAGESGSASVTGTPISPTIAPVSTGGASKMMVGAGAVVGGALALLL
jgi:hypothetical protein